MPVLCNKVFNSVKDELCDKQKQKQNKTKKNQLSLNYSVFHDLLR